MIRAEPITEAETKRSRGIQDMALGRSDLLRMDPRTLRIEPGFNARLVNFNPDDEEDLNLARSIAEVGIKHPLIVWMRNGEPTVTDGHRRLSATIYAMDVLGTPIKPIPVFVEPKHASETDRAYTVLISDASRHLAPIERANHYAKLIGYGETEAEIAAKIGRSRQHVTELLKFRAAPQAVVEMVKAGDVSASLAMSTLREAKGDGAAAAETLATGLATAKAAGKTRATARHVERKPQDLSKHPAYAAGLKRAVEVVREGGWAEAADALEAVMGE